MDCFLPQSTGKAAPSASPCCCCDHPNPEGMMQATPTSHLTSTFPDRTPQHPLMHYPSDGYHVQLISKSDPAAIKLQQKVRNRKRTLSYGASNLQYDSSNVTYADDDPSAGEVVQADDGEEEKENEGKKEEEVREGVTGKEAKNRDILAEEKMPNNLETRGVVDDAGRLRHRANLSKMTMLTCYVITVLVCALLPSLTFAGNESQLPSGDSRFPRDADGEPDESAFDRRDAVTHIARVVGSDVALPCNIAGPGNVVIGQDADARLKWVKRNPKKTVTEGEHILIDNWEKRFELSRDNYTLYIKNVEISDGARYQCTTVSRPMVDGKEKGRRPSTTVFLTVFEPPRCDAWDPLETGQWVAGDINFGGECSTVARGGAKPSLEWSRASTGQSGLGTPDIYPGDPPQILSSFYFKPSHEDQGTNLTCELIHPHLSPEDEGKFTCVIGPMEILFDVIFFCDSEQYVDPSDSEFNVTCDVWANPPVDPTHLFWIPQNLDKPPLSDLINTSDCWQARQKTFQTSSYKVAPHVTRTTVTVDKHLDKFVDYLDFVLQARLNSKKNISMMILDPNAERRMIQGFDEDLFISMLMIVIGGVIVLSALLVVFVFGAYDWYQSFRPRDYDYSYEKLRKIEATKRVAEKAANSNATIASAAAAANDAHKPQARAPPTATVVNRHLHNRHSMISSLSS